MVKENILVVEDKQDTLELVLYCLGRNNYRIETAAFCDEAIAKAKIRIPELIILDHMLSGTDGFDVYKKLKGDDKIQNIPIIMLITENEDEDIISGLEPGVDDYVTKPFHPKILAAKVLRILQRIKIRDLEKAPVKIHELIIDPSRRQVIIKDKPMDLTFTEFNILYELAKRPGMVFTRYQIVDTLHGNDYLVTDRAVDVQIAGLRKKLGLCGNYIETVRGVGYRFKD